MKVVGLHCGINTRPKWQVRLSPLGGGQSGTLTTRPEAVFGHRVTNCTVILEIKENVI